MTQTQQRKRRLRFAREGVPFIVAPLVLGLAAVAIGWSIGGAILILLALFCLLFFRDPDRDTPAQADVLVAPADGTVAAVEQTPDGLRISIFLSVFNVHVNRSPAAGVVHQVKYHPGRFLAANFDKSSDENERNTVVLETPRGEIRVVQIAGIIARRIICRVQAGDDLDLGQRFGLIRFGSRTDLFAPGGYLPEVRIGSKVRGASTILARWEQTGEK